MTDPYALGAPSLTTSRTPSPVASSPVVATPAPAASAVPDSVASTSPGTGPARRSTTLWWVLLTLAVTANLVSSAGAAPLAVGLAAGAVTLVSITALVLARVRRR